MIDEINIGVRRTCFREDEQTKASALSTKNSRRHLLFQATPQRLERASLVRGNFQPRSHCLPSVNAMRYVGNPCPIRRRCTQPAACNASPDSLHALRSQYNGINMHPKPALIGLQSGRNVHGRTQSSIPDVRHFPGRSSCLRRGEK